MARNLLLRSALLLCGSALSFLLSGCHASRPFSDGNSPYFGIHDTTKKFVPEELHETKSEASYDESW